MRRLRTLVDRQPLLCDVPVGYHRARLQRHPGVPPEDEIRLHHFVGAGKRRVDLTDVKVTLEGEIVTKGGMNDRRFRIKRGTHVRYRIELLVYDPDQFRSVLRDGTAGRHDGRNGFALPADAINRDRVLSGGLKPLEV